MSPLRRSAAVFVALLLAPAASHATCGAEGCPLVRDGLGTARSRFAFDLRYQDVTQDQLWDGSRETELSDAVAEAGKPGVHGEVELYTRTRSWVAEGRVRLTGGLRLTATLPYIQREHRHLLAHTPVFNPAFVDTWEYEGVADATVLAHYKLPRLAGLPELGAVGGVKLPTGRTHVGDEARNNFGYESTLEPSARPGTGSTDWLAGAQASQPLPWSRALPITASLLARFNGKGTDRYRVGDELQAGLSGGWAPVERLTLLAQVNFAGHGSDVSADPAEAAHTGMKSLYLTPGASVRVSPALSLYALYQARVWTRSDEATVVAKDHLLLGTTWSFGR